MPRAGFEPPAQSHACYEASALPQSHHGWFFVLAVTDIKFRTKICFTPACEYT